MHFTQRPRKQASVYVRVQQGSVQGPCCSLVERFCIGVGFWTKSFRRLGSNHDVTHPRYGYSDDRVVPGLGPPRRNRRIGDLLPKALMGPRQVEVRGIGLQDAGELLQAYA